MCTLIAIHRRIPGAPLVVAANRDEFLDRPTEGPAVRDGDPAPVLAPRDVRAGGTWLGLGAHGVFAAVTKSPSGQNYEANAADSDRITQLVIAQRWPPRTWGSLHERAIRVGASVCPRLYHPGPWLWR